MSKNETLASNAQPTQGTTVTEKEQLICAICGKPITDDPYGHNPWPVAEGRCCTECNRNVVIPARMFLNAFFNEIGDGPMRAWWEGYITYENCVEIDGMYFTIVYGIDDGKWSVIIEDSNLDEIGILAGECQDGNPNGDFQKIAMSIFNFLINEKK